MIRKFARTSLSRSRLHRIFSLQQNLSELTKNLPDLPDEQAYDLAARLSVGLYEETLAVRDLTVQVLYQLKEHNPHKEGTKEYVDFVFQHNFNPEIHPGFFETYDNIVKHYSGDLEPHIVFGQLNKFIVKERASKTPEDMVKTPEGFSLANYDNSILLSFMGMHNTLYFPVIKQNFGVDYVSAIDSVQCYKDTIGYFGVSTDRLMAYANSLIENPDSFKDQEST